MSMYIKIIYVRANLMKMFVYFTIKKIFVLVWKGKLLFLNREKDKNKKIGTEQKGEKEKNKKKEEYKKNINKYFCKKRENKTKENKKNDKITEKRYGVTKKANQKAREKPYNRRKHGPGPNAPGGARSFVNVRKERHIGFAPQKPWRARGTRGLSLSVAGLPSSSCSSPPRARPPAP